MNLFKLSWRNLCAKPLSTFLSILLLTLGIGLVAYLLKVNEQVEEQFVRNIKGIDMVVGAKGSPLQLILSNVYHIDYPTGNISLNEANKLLKNKAVKKGIPLAYGDRYDRFRIVGTTASYVEHYKGVLQSGRLWEADLEVTIGHTVAQKLDLKIGDTFYGSHGLVGNEEVHKEKPYTIVGILEATGTVMDQLILTAISSVWAIHDTHDHGSENAPIDQHANAEGEEHHDHEHEAHHTEADKAITALLITFKNRAMGLLRMPKMVNETTDMQAALPAVEINRLTGTLGVGFTAMRWIAYLVVLVAGMSIFIALYNSLKERKYEMALMRSLGASRYKLFSMILLEGLLLSFMGYLLGIFLAKIGLLITTKWLIEGYNYKLQDNLFHKVDASLLIAALSIGFLAALLPAIQAFRTNISKTLAKG